MITTLPLFCPVSTCVQGSTIRPRGYEAAVIVENDANARAVVEPRQHQTDNLISLKVGSGIGSGLVFNGQIIRANEGASGDIGHTRAAPSRDGTPLPCRCGNVGCIEAYAGGWALACDLQDAGVAVDNEVPAAGDEEPGHQDV